MGDTDKKFIVYQASAGSGKTYTLVKEYLKLVLPQPDKYRRILAVTFTNKAAFEMKSRVIEYLQVLSAIDATNPDTEVARQLNKYRPLINSLVKDTGLSETQLKERANLVLEKILHNYSDFAICTIDSFVQRIIRTFAFDLKIPHNFEIELDAVKVLSQAVDLIISYVGVNADITDVLVEFVRQKIAEDKNWDIESDLKEFSKELLKEDTQKYINLFKDINLADFNKINNKYYSRLNNMNKEATDVARHVLDAIDSTGVSPKAFYYGKTGIYGFFVKVVKGGLGNASMNSYYHATIDEGKWYSGSASSDDKQCIDSLKEVITGGFRSIEASMKPYKDLLVVTRSLYPLSLLNLIKGEMQALKTEGNFIFISDFYSKINEQLLNEPVPFIYQRTGEVFEHFFIDEFQDTSILQFQNMLPLIDNSIANGNVNFIVGDGKQAIYRWRNGEVRQFSGLPNVFQKPDSFHFDDFEHSLNRNFTTYQGYNPETQLVNYRSRKEIVEFNNELFEFLNRKVQNEEYQKIYHQLVQQSKPDNTGGYVNIRFVDNEDNYQDNQLEAVINTVKQLIAENVPLKDIAIICRKNKEATAIAVKLLAESIDVVSSESLMLKSSDKVNFIISLLRTMQNPTDSLSVATVLIFFHQHFVKDLTLHDFLESYRNASKEKYVLYVLEEIMQQYGFEFSFNLLTTFSLFDMNEEILRIFGLNKLADPFMIFYLEAVNEFVKKQSADLSGFLAWWDEYGVKKSITVPDELNAVKVMTIHKAKGQEFPVVIYPFADEDAKVKGGSLTWIDSTGEVAADIPAVPVQLSKSMLENSSFLHLYEEEKARLILDMLNICYVALTRAEDRLYVLSKNKISKESITFGSLLIDFLMHKSLWNEGQYEYEFGDKPPMSDTLITKETNNKNISLDTIISSNWFKRVLIKPESAKAWDENAKDNSLVWGNIIHTVLSEMNTADDVDKAVARQLNEGMISAEDTAKVLSYINDNMLGRDDIRVYFQAGQRVAAEIEILTPENNVYRPDRIIFGESGNIIIDYKTGREEEKHKEQVRNYGKLVTEITGKPSEMVLIYLHDTQKVIKVN